MSPGFTIQCFSSLAESSCKAPFERQKDAGLSKLFGKQLLSLFVPFVIWNILDALLCLAFHTPIYSLASNAVWFLAVLCFAHCAIIPVRKVTRKAVILLLFALLLAGMLASAFIASFLAKVFTFTCIVYLGFIIERFPLPKRTAIIVNLLLLGHLPVSRHTPSNGSTP